MRRSALILSFILLLIPVVALSQSPAIDAGLGYLTSSQNPDRSWGGAGGSTGTVASTVAVLDAMKLLNQTDLYEYTGAVSWLQKQDLTTTENLSERINALTIGGADATRLLSYLDSLMNAWGGYDDYGVSTIDTVYAVQAFRTINHPDSATFAAALGYLTSIQNADGGWGFFKGDASNTYVTSQILRVLSELKATYTGLQPAIAGAVNFVLSKQDPVSGGFGSSPSTVHETALAYEALVASGMDVSAAVPQAINYLLTTQQQNGSWNNDAYATALALHALSNVKPNLSVSSADIIFSDTNLTVGEHITISAIIKNTGMVAADRVTVNIYDGDPLKGAQPLISQIIPTMSAGGQTTLTVPYTVSGTGSHAITVWVDPLNQISEATKDDNRASRNIWGATLPDVAVLSGDIAPSTFYPAPGAAFDVAFKLRNLGETEAYPVNTALYDGNPSQGGTIIGYGMPTTVKGGETRGNVVTGAVLNTAGQHTLYLVANYDNQVTESSLANNTASFTVNVGGTPPPVDLAILPGDLTITPQRPATGETVEIRAWVRNLGQDLASGFLMEFYDGDPSAGGVLIDRRTLSLYGGNDQIVAVNWVVPAGIHTIYAIADRTNVVAETDELNNRTSVTIMADMVDIVVTASDMVFTPAYPVNGDNVTFTANVRNTGIMATGPFTVELYDGDPTAGGVLLQTYAVSNLLGDSSQTLTYSFTAIPHTYRFYVKADTQAQVVEMYEDNNLAVRSLKVKAPSEVKGPDLIPVKFDLSDTTTDPQSLAISGKAHVTFQNKGDDKIVTPFNILVFEDKDNDGKYTQGIDTLLGMSTFVTGPTASVPALWPEGAGMVDVTLSGGVKFLHSPLYALIDSSDAIVEQSKANNLMKSGADCENRPANPIQSDIEVKWRWKNAYNAYRMATPPIVMHLTDDNNDGKIDENDIPAVVFITGHEDSTLEYGGYGRLFALRGDTGAQLFTYYDLYHGPAKGYVAGGDIDGDGVPDIIVNGRPWNYSTGGFLAISNTGTLKWDNYLQAKAWTDQPGYYYGYAYGAAEIADVDADGFPDIISGKTVINNNGSIKFGNNYGGIAADVGRLGQSHAVDLDLDGKLEVLAGFTAYKPNTRDPWWNHPELLYSRDTLDAVGNLDDDPYPEIVMASTYFGRTQIFIVKYNGTIIRGPIELTTLNLPDTGFAGYGSIPVIADADGDGEPEILITGNGWLFILDKNGDLKRKLSIPGYNTQPHSATVFDLNSDGRPEVMVHTFGHFRIFDGPSGQLLFEDSFGASRMQQNAVLVADVNGDGQAEIVVNGYDETSPAPKYGDGVRVYGTKNNNWANARRVWNQLGYHVTNVNDNGSIPQHEPQSWLLNNTYQCQAKVGTSTNPFLTPNMTASYLRSGQSGTGYDLTVRIGNGGAVEAPAGIPVLFYDGNPSTGGTVIVTTATTRTLLPGEYQDITVNIASLSDGQHALYAKVDGGPTFKECNTSDNQVRLDLTIASGMPDIKIGSEDISVSSTTVTEGSIVTLSVNVKNIGLATASNFQVKLANGNPAAGGVWIGLPQTISSISAGGSATLTFTYDTLGKAGQNILYISVDPDSTVAEATKANNTASISINVLPPQAPNLVIDAAGITLSPAGPREGEQVAITATVTNRGASAGNIPVRFSLGNPASGGTTIADQAIYPVLGLGQSASVSATLNTIGLAGQREVFVTIDPANTIFESSKSDNAASKPVFIQSAGLTATVSLDKSAYQQNESVSATITAVNTTANARALFLSVMVKDSAGNVVAAVGPSELVAINPSGTVTLSRSWNTGSTLAGSYTMSIELSESSLTIARNAAGFSITPDKRIEAKASTSKAAYYPNENAELTAVVVSNSANYVYENLTAVLTVLPVNGQSPSLKTETRTIKSLMPGASYAFKSYWSVGTNPAGAYPVSLLVTDSTGSTVATGTGTLTITGDLKPSALLSGHITLDKQSTMSSEPVSATYTVSNVGNVDLSNVALSIKTVHVKNETVFGTMTETVNLPLASAVTNTRVIDTASYAAMDYLVVLQASINGGPEETIAGSYFRVEGAPTTPSLSAPANGSDVQTLTPVVTVNNAADPNDDRLTYEFAVYDDSGLTTLLTSTSGIGQGTGTTSWQVPLDLIENSTYFWRARAYDGKLQGDWMQTASFRVNVANDLPSAPTIASPADNTEVSSLTPILTVNNAFDPDSTGLTYNFQVALDSACTQTVASVVGVPSGQGSTSWQVAPSLSENTWYYWCAQADDWLAAGPWSSSARFFVNTANDAPTVPVILSPANNAVAPSLNVDIVLQNSIDVDSPVISYAFEVDRLPTFDSPGIIRSGVIPAGAGTTTWPAIGLLDNSRYYIRAMASDGSAGSSWTQAISIFVNTANDAPTTPVIANPSNGAGVNVFTPTFSVHNATDLDRDALTYEFEVYSDAALTNLVDRAAGIAETPSITSWTATVLLTENQTYYWRSRASDGSLNSNWVAGWFVVNTANDAPSSPTALSPLDGSTLATLTPMFTFGNATDPDSDQLTYELQVFAGGSVVASITGIAENSSGQTSVMLQSPLADNAAYLWQVRAFDGDRYGPWTALAGFTVHVSQTGITVDLEIEPETLNQQSNGNWVMAEIELPHGYNASDVDISSIRLEGTVPAVAWPHEKKNHHHDHGCDADHSEHDHGEIKVKFSRSAVIAVLPAGEHVPVHVTGMVGGTHFEGVDFIRVIH